MIHPAQGAQPVHCHVAKQAQTYLNDAKACGSPKGLRIHLQQYDTLVQQQHVQRLTTYSALCMSAAVVAGYAPAFVRASKNCLAIVSVETTARCQGEGAQAVAAIVGLSGFALASYALYLSWGAAGQYVRRLDDELQDRFEKTLAHDKDKSCVSQLMTRYSLMSNKLREDVKEGLFNFYLENKKAAAAS